jgi:hypothetical protein
VQADNVTIADHAAPFAAGSAARSRRRGLETELLERKGRIGELDGKAWVARADSILGSTLPREIFIDLLAVREPTLQDEETFKKGSATAHVYLYDPASSRFTCAGSFTAESSDVVEERRVLIGKYWLDVNFYMNLVDAAGAALRDLTAP